MKKSAIDWAPYIPEDWEEKRIKDVSRLQSGDGITSDDIDEIGLYPVYGGNGFRGFTDTYTNVGSYVLIGRQGALCGNINYAKDKFYASEQAVVVYPYCRDENITWLGETLRAANLNRLSASAAQPGLAVSALNYVMIPYPPKPQRERIGKYLEEKIPLIDTQIELLGKKKDAYTRLKKAIINRAVTRGLDEHVKLKDSGVEWIGMIPEHWEVYRFKDVYNKSNVGESIDKEYCTDNEADYLFYTAGIIPIRTDFEEFPQWKYTNRNDLLLARNGTPYVYLPKCNSVYSDHIIRVDIKKGFFREYIRFCLQQAISTEVIDSVSIPTWSISIWNKQLMPFPPLSEQQAIVAYLDEKCAKIDAAIANIDKQIDALKRLKRSLINEVITGHRAV